MNIYKTRFFKLSQRVDLRKSFSSVQSTFEDEYRKNYIETSLFQKTLLTAGAAVVSILDPHRGDMIACLGETTGERSAKYIIEKMENSREAPDTPTPTYKRREGGPRRAQIVRK